MWTIFNNNRGMINGQQLKTILIISGLSKSSSANKEGIKNHLKDHPETALTKPNELIAAVLKAHMFDINEERTSEISAAFVSSAPSPRPAAVKKPGASPWKWRKDLPGYAEIPGATHCANCHKLCGGLYFYSHSTERCTKDAASVKAWKDKQEARLHAKVAAVGIPIPAPAQLSVDEKIEKGIEKGILAYMASMGFEFESET